MASDLEIELQKQRAIYQMTLGELMHVLKNCDDDLPVRFADGVGVGELIAHHGYRLDVAFCGTSARSRVKNVRARIGLALLGKHGPNIETPIWRHCVDGRQMIAAVGTITSPDCVLICTRNLRAKRASI